MPRFRRKKMTTGRTGVKHATSFLDNIGSGSVPTTVTLVETDAGTRKELHQNIQSTANTDETCRTGDLIKYLNVHLQIASRSNANFEATGWLEYAIYYKKEVDAQLAITNLGTQTVGETATNLYRNDCWWTGFIPTSLTGANGAELALKIPKTRQFLKIGDQFQCVCYYRSNSSASVATDTMRVIVSANFKAYS